MKTVALILARGGSKGIPKKNIKELNGAPLISYVIDAAINSNASETWVSTDCQEIRDISLEHGANVIKRPKEISGDNDKNELAIEHFLENIGFDFVISIQPTSPLLLAEDINGGLDLIVQKDCDSVFSATKDHWIPRWTKENEPLNWDINNRPMRQDMPETYIENGAFYITTKKLFLKNKLRYGGRIKPYCMPLSRSFQIDSLEDFNLINSILNERYLYNR
jgi:CMP-N-acetylneuraminic acid synthetase